MAIFGLAAVIAASYQSDIGEDLQLQYEPAFLAFFARLRVPRSLVGRSLEIIVAQASPSALAEDSLLTVLHHLEQGFAGFGILCHGAYGNFQEYVFSVLSGTESSLPVATVVGLDVFAVFEVYQGPELLVRPQDNVSATSSVSSVRTAFRDVFGPVQVHRAGPSVPAGTEYLDVVYEVGFSHNSSYKGKYFYGVMPKRVIYGSPGPLFQGRLQTGHPGSGQGRNPREGPAG